MFGEARKEVRDLDFVDETKNAEDCFFGNDCLRRWNEVRPDSEQPFLSLRSQLFVGGEAVATAISFL